MRQAGIVGIVGDAVAQQHLGLANRLDLRIFQARQRAAIGHVGVQHAARMRRQLVDRGVDAEGRALDLAVAVQHLAVEADLDQVAGGHFRPIEAERIDQEAAGLAGNGRRQVVEDALVEPLQHRHAVRRRQVDADLPLGLAELRVRTRRVLRNQLHVTLTTRNSTKPSTQRAMLGML